MKQAKQLPSSTTVADGAPIAVAKQLSKIRLTDATFLSYAANLRLSEPVRLAAYAVLVHGHETQRATNAHGVSRSAVYRAIGQLLKPHAPKLARAGYDVPEHRLAALDKLVHAQLDVWLIEDEEEAARAAEVLRNGGDGAGLTTTAGFDWD